MPPPLQAKVGLGRILSFSFLVDGQSVHDDTTHQHPQQVPRKIAILGFRATGKTTLATHFVEGQFVER
jgi:hypothetical protein